MSEPRYSIGTYDWETANYTPQIGLCVPSFNITIWQLRQALKHLRRMGYTAHRKREPGGTHGDNNDTSVLVERTDGKSEAEILEDWKR